MKKGLNDYEKFLRKENFKLAYFRLRNASRTLYKTLYYEDLKTFGLYLEENIDSVINLIRSGIYSPQKCNKIFIPKKDNFVRPLSLLTFVDLLVYQAIVNIIADKAFDVISPYYDNTIFGNVINTSTSADNQFFFKSWKRKWKRFNEVSKSHFSSGYKFLSEFDIASYFDTIDHNILTEILANIFLINEELLKLLSKCLETWTADSNHVTFKSKHGIPQGPISSPLLSDLYLFYLDKEIRKVKSQDFKYIRYVDDIRIFSRDYLTSQKLIAALDLISRDLGLIPQSSKILIKEIVDIDKELKQQNSKFSDITKEYRKSNEGKPSGQLKARTQRNLKQRLIAVFDKNSTEQYLDKSLIGFSLFKLNRDEEIRDLLIDNYKLILTYFEGVLYYLKRHFGNDPLVNQFILNILNDENILFHHLVALCLKQFPEFPFNERIYYRYTFEKHRHWLVNYYIIPWLFYNNKKELLLTQTNTDNHFIYRQLNKYKYAISTDLSYRKIFATKLLSDTNEIIALQGLSLLFNDIHSLLGFQISNDHHDFIKYIYNKRPPDIINYTIHNQWKIENSERFFNRDIWPEDLLYEELSVSFTFIIKSSTSDASKALLNLNIFNNLIFDRICQNLSIKKVSGEYGGNLKANILESTLPKCNKIWTEINENRNQRTDAHPYDKIGNVRLRISIPEFAEILRKEILAIEELCEYRNWVQ